MTLVLTGVSADERGPSTLLGQGGVGRSHQLVLGHLGVGLGEFQPQGLGDFRVEPDTLQARGTDESSGSQPYDSALL